MSVIVAKASEAERGIVERLLQLCLHDYTSHDPFPIGEDAVFGYRWWDLYWNSPNRCPYLLRFENRLAGFAFVRAPEEDELCEWQWQIAEFFILRALRGKKIGMMAALAILRTKTGIWEVSYDTENEAARYFWASVAKSFDPTTICSPVGAGRERFLFQNRNTEANQNLRPTEQAK